MDFSQLTGWKVQSDNNVLIVCVVFTAFGIGLFLILVLMARKCLGSCLVLRRYPERLTEKGWK